LPEPRHGTGQAQRRSPRSPRARQARLGSRTRSPNRSLPSPRSGGVARRCGSHWRAYFAARAASSWTRCRVAAHAAGRAPARTFPGLGPPPHIGSGTAPERRGRADRYGPPGPPGQDLAPDPGAHIPLHGRRRSILDGPRSCDRAFSDLFGVGPRCPVGRKLGQRGGGIRGLHEAPQSMSPSRARTEWMAPPQRAGKPFPGRDRNAALIGTMLVRENECQHEPRVPVALDARYRVNPASDPRIPASTPRGVGCARQKQACRDLAVGLA
jgi:hypothetical protein